MTSSDIDDLSVGGGDDLYKWKAFGAVGSFFVTAVLAMTMVFVVLPAIAEDFDVTLRSASWVVIAYALTISALLLPFGRLADLAGRRRVHLTGLALFGVGTTLVALSGSFTTLLIARVVMGVGDAMSQSVGTGILVSVFPQRERGKAIGAQTTSVAIGAAAGPLVAGLVLIVLPWRALFALLVVPTIFSFIFGYLVLDEDRVSGTERKTEPFDWGGAVLSTLAITLLVLTINNPFALSWLSMSVILPGVAALALFGIFTWWELQSPAPMLQLRFFADPVFSRAVLARVIGFVPPAAIAILIPILLISLRGMSEGRASTTIFLNSVGLGFAAHFAGRLSDRLGTRPFMISGFAVSAVVMLVLAAMDRSTPVWVVAVVILVAGLAMGSWNVTNNATIIGSVPSSSYGVVGAFTNLARNVGTVFGQAVVAAVVAGIMATQGFDVPLADIGESVEAGDAFLDGWRVAFVVMAGLAVVSCLFAVFTRPTRSE